MARSKKRKSRRSSNTRNTAASKNNQASQSSRNEAGQSGAVRQDFSPADGTAPAVPADALTPASSNGTSASDSSHVPAGSSPSFSRGQGDNTLGRGSKDSGFYGLSSSEASAMDDFDDIPLDPSSLDLWFLQDAPALAPFSEAGQDDSLFDGDLFDIIAEESRGKAQDNSQDNSKENTPGKAPDNSPDNSQGKAPGISQEKTPGDSPDNSQKNTPGDSREKTPDNSQEKTSGDSLDEFQGKALGNSRNNSRKGSRNKSRNNSRQGSRSDTPDNFTSADGREIPGTAGSRTGVDQAADGVSAKSSQWKSAVAGAMSSAPAANTPGVPGGDQAASGTVNLLHTGIAGEPPSSDYNTAEVFRTSSARDINSTRQAQQASGQGAGNSYRPKQALTRAAGFPRWKPNNTPAGDSSSGGKDQPAFVRQMSAYSAITRTIITVIGILFCLMVVMYFRARNAGAVPNPGIILPILQSHQESVELNNTSDEDANAEPAVDINASPDSVPEDSAAQESQEPVNTEQAEETAPAVSDYPVDQGAVQQDNGVNAENTDNVDNMQDGYIEEGQTYNDGTESQNYEDGNTYNEGEAAEENGGDQLGDYYQEGTGYYDDDGRYYEEVENQDENEDEYEDEDEEDW